MSSITDKNKILLPFLMLRNRSVIVETESGFGKNVDSYDSEMLESIARESVYDGDIQKAVLAYGELSKRDYGNLHDIALQGLSDSSSLSKAPRDDTSISHKTKNSVAYIVEKCVSRSEEGKISLDDLLVIEKIVDRISVGLKRRDIEERETYERMYLKFKEYILNAYCKR